MSEDPDTPRLGSCCICGGSEDVTNIVMLDHKVPLAGRGRGWGCVQCGLSADGAVAVVCGDCLGRPIQFVCVGYPGEDRRVPISEVIDTRHDHDRSKHPETW